MVHEEPSGSGGKIERRRAPRLKPEGLLAHYWTGGLSIPRLVREIGLYGAVVEAPEVYYPGTVIRIALEDVAAEENRPDGIKFGGIWGKVLRNVSGGFCLAFVFETWAERRDLCRFLDQLGKRGLHATNGDHS